jgi:hypothetical protein
MNKRAADDAELVTLCLVASLLLLFVASLCGCSSCSSCGAGGCHYPTGSCSSRYRPPEVRK